MVVGVFLTRKRTWGLGFCDVSIREWRVWEVERVTSFWFKAEVLSKKCVIWWDFFSFCGRESINGLCMGKDDGSVR
jgi:hypothetical protein